MCLELSLHTLDKVVGCCSRFQAWLGTPKWVQPRSQGKVTVRFIGEMSLSRHLDMARRDDRLRDLADML